LGNSRESPALRRIRSSPTSATNSPPRIYISTHPRRDGRAGVRRDRACAVPREALARPAFPLGQRTERVFAAMISTHRLRPAAGSDLPGPAQDFGSGPDHPGALSKNISKRVHPHRDLSTALRSGRDDKGEDGASSESSYGTKAVFHQLRWAPGPMIPLSKMSLRRIRSPILLPYP
jgi:hypothetical protein